MILRSLALRRHSDSFDRKLGKGWMARTLRIAGVAAGLVEEEVSSLSAWPGGRIEPEEEGKENLTIKAVGAPWAPRPRDGIFAQNRCLTGKYCSPPPDRGEKIISFSNLHNKQHVHYGQAERIQTSLKPAASSEFPALSSGFYG